MADGRLDAAALSSLPDDALMAELTAIPGIGPWTVQGALLIALHGKTSCCRAISSSVRLSKTSQRYEPGTLPSRPGP